MNITDAVGERSMRLEFVLPGGRITDMGRLDDARPWSPSSSPSPPSQPSPSSPSSRITPRSDDLELSLNKPNSGVPLVSAFKKPPGGGFDWS
jgi:hypothetical protein